MRLTYLKETIITQTIHNIHFLPTIKIQVTAIILSSSNLILPSRWRLCMMSVHLCFAIHSKHYAMHRTEFIQYIFSSVVFYFDHYLIIAIDLPFICYLYFVFIFILFLAFSILSLCWVRVRDSLSFSPFLSVCMPRDLNAIFNGFWLVIILRKVVKRQ